MSEHGYTMIEELAKELGISLDSEGRGHFATRFPPEKVTFDGGQLMYVLLLRRDLAYWREARKHRWIPCAERMPEYGAPVLAWALWDDDELSETYGATGLVWVAQLDHSGDWLQRDSRLDFRVTHWMPLPEGPEVEG